MRRLTPDQKRARMSRRRPRAAAMPADTFVPIVREVKLKEGRKPNRKQRRAMLVQIRRSMQIVGSRLVKRVRRRRELDGADWLKQMRRDQRKAQSVPRSPELKAKLDIINEEHTTRAERYKSVPTPEMVEAGRPKHTKDERASKR